MDLTDWLEKVCSCDETYPQPLACKSYPGISQVSRFTACARAPGKLNMSLGWATGVVRTPDFRLFHTCPTPVF